jgi:hypothetical protein
MPTTRIPLVVFVLALATTACELRRWTDHDAYRRCAAAIDAWPHAPAPPCTAMRMCANEAVLDPSQRAALERMIRASGCAPL